MTTEVCEQWSICSRFLFSMLVVKLFIGSVDSTSSPSRANTVDTCRGRIYAMIWKLRTCEIAISRSFLKQVDQSHNAHLEGHSGSYRWCIHHLSRPKNLIKPQFSLVKRPFLCICLFVYLFI